jgi:hypothetical protein
MSEVKNVAATPKELLSIAIGTAVLTAVFVAALVAVVVFSTSMPAAAILTAFSGLSLTTSVFFFKKFVGSW